MSRSAIQREDTNAVSTYVFLTTVQSVSNVDNAIADDTGSEATGLGAGIDAHAAARDALAITAVVLTALNTFICNCGKVLTARL